MRGRQCVVTGQAHPIISGAASEFDQLVCDGAPDPTSSAGCGDEHASHFTRSIVERLYRARADDPGFANRAQKQCPIAICSFGVVDVRQARSDEISHKRIGMTIKVLMPNGFNEPTSPRCIAMLEWPNCPVRSRAREVCHGVSSPSNEAAIQHVARRAD
jgi:hypothetical protein